MALEQLQLFLTRYLRDADFRERYRGADASALTAELKLSREDLDLIRAIDIKDLDRSAINMRDERRSKRETEFQQFVDHLAVYGPMDAFFEQYDRAHSDGLLTRPQEMDRFLDFATDFILKNGLPEYLVDLLRFCYHYVKVADMPCDRSIPILEDRPAKGLRPSFRVALLKPYRIVDFRRDVLFIARQTPSVELAQLPPAPTQVIIQKSWSRAKETHIFYTRELPLLPRLFEGTVAVIDLVSLLPANGYPDGMSHINELLERSVIGIVA